MKHKDLSPDRLIILKNHKNSDWIKGNVKNDFLNEMYMLIKSKIMEYTCDIVTDIDHILFHLIYF